MRRFVTLTIPLLMALLTIGIWGLLNQPSPEPPWPAQIQGFSFNPIQIGQDPSKKIFPTSEEIDGDLALMEGRAHAVRSYTVEDNLGEIARLAIPHHLNVNLGAWIGPFPDANERELKRLMEILRRGYSNIVRVTVGNESLLRQDVSITTLLGYLDRIRDQIELPVSTAEPWHVWLKYPELVDHVDYITVHLLPYWEGLPIDQAVSYAINRFNEVQAAYPDKRVIIGEVGWPSNGRTNRGAEASQANQTRFLRRFIAQAEKAGYVYYVMEAFDQPWKAKIEGATGTYWGVYNAEREPKFNFTQPVVRIPQWQELAALSVASGILVLMLLYRDSSTLSSSGKGFLALVTYAISTAAVWIIYDYTRQYMTPATTVVGLLLLVGGIGVILLLIAETHEWAEALWLHQWRRSFPKHSPPDDELPCVSIHVPAYNEPPELLIETLDALSRLDYPRFEVLVIDNNTKDPAVWQPVRDHCASLGERFRFFHVDPLAGFKAGALNFALRETDPAAEIVAVIDADYVVMPRWLRDLTPAFVDPDIAIVQAPQDYRDGNQNAFKAMCLAEYRGFFHIGMVTRNERNAIIQHGTMTMIRRATLADANGWAEWCITEDAELGLRLFERGCKALYIPATYGRGLIPDSFADFRQQRFRWAYGAVRILARHWRELFGLRSTELSAGQRYHFIAGWLPWFADGFNLLFNFAALGWTVAMTIYPERVTPPYLSVALVPLVLFGFKLAKSFFLYRRRVTATLRQSIAAGLAGLALSHTIARASLAGMVSGRMPFLRTPKLADSPALIQALGDAREEAVFALALWLGAFCVLLRDDAYMLDVQVWVAVLLVQSIPYFATVLVSLVSAANRLPARLIGTMPEMKEDSDLRIVPPPQLGRPAAEIDPTDASH